MGLFQDGKFERSCFRCEHYAGQVADYSHAACARGKYPLVQARPRTGCVHWVQAIGIDDDTRPIDPFQGSDRR
ncbi:hypothetical protein BZM27_12725 [Paraburkholderia steynii]|uniref:Uncharacterized protein n=1 Tax=Paraburkholderia steynii TaxID=1245441 RepID=A0A4R0XK22_9BURK|nr:hypothetical protein BZM27_12725 [Paraburkholderia steynii]